MFIVFRTGSELMITRVDYIAGAWRWSGFRGGPGR